MTGPVKGHEATSAILRAALGGTATRMDDTRAASRRHDGRSRMEDFIVHDLVRIYFDCGWLDLAVFQGWALHERLRTLPVPHAFETYLGSHDWPGWRGRLEEALMFLTR